MAFSIGLVLSTRSLRKRGCEKIKSAFSFWPMAFSLACDSLLKLLIQVKYNMNPEI
jgi:hypothetical protein